MEKLWSGFKDGFSKVIASLLWKVEMLGIVAAIMVGGPLLFIAFFFVIAFWGYYILTLGGMLVAYILISNSIKKERTTWVSHENAYSEIDYLNSQLPKESPADKVLSLLTIIVLFPLIVYGGYLTVAWFWPVETIGWGAYLVIIPTMQIMFYLLHQKSKKLYFKVEYHATPRSYIDDCG